MEKAPILETMTSICRVRHWGTWVPKLVCQPLCYAAPVLASAEPKLPIVDKWPHMAKKKLDRWERLKHSSAEALLLNKHHSWITNASGPVAKLTFTIKTRICRRKKVEELLHFCQRLQFLVLQLSFFFCFCFYVTTPLNIFEKIKFLYVLFCCGSEYFMQEVVF